MTGIVVANALTAVAYLIGGEVLRREMLREPRVVGRLAVVLVVGWAWLTGGLFALSTYARVAS